MKRTMALGAAAALAGLLLLHGQEAAGAAREAIALCAGSVIPALFPFLAVTGLAVRLDAAGVLERPARAVMGPLFGMEGACALPLATGLVGGYPAGAAAAAELYREGSVSREEAELLLGFCNNCGPAFIIGFAGSEVLGSGRAGAALYAIHLLSALLAGVILCRTQRARGRRALPCRTPQRPLSLPDAFTGAVAGAVRSTAGICAYVVLFRTVGTVLPLPRQAGWALEMVGAIAGLEPGRAGFVAAAGILGWGGLCVHCQTMAAAQGLSLRRHFMGKALQCALSVLLAAAVSR